MRIYRITKVTREDFSYSSLSYIFYEIEVSIQTSKRRLANIAKKYGKSDLWLKYYMQEEAEFKTIYSPSLNHTKIGVSANELRRYLKSVNKLKPNSAFQ